MIKGKLWLIPVGLGARPWNHWLPQAVRDKVCELNHFVVENSKSARVELKRLEHPTPLRELHIEALPEYPTNADLDSLLAPALSGIDLGLLSEAGCPAVADPGALLVRRAHELDVSVKPLVGPSSLLLALMASGLEGQRFAFHGYLPARDPDRSKRIGELERESARRHQTQLFIETPYRNQALFTSLLATCQPQTRLAIASELTEVDELVASRLIREWRAATAPVLDKRPTVFLLLA